MNGPDIMDDLEVCPVDERRTASRAQMSFAISLRERGRNRQGAFLTNLSPFGCAVKDLFLVAEQQTVWIKLPGLESQAAKIQWAKEAGAGFAFDYPLDPRVLARFVNSTPSDGPTRSRRSAFGLHEVQATSSRKDQILAGWVDPSERLLARKQPLPNGKAFPGLIKRRTSRVADHRRERRYLPPTATAANVKIAEDRAKLLNLSSSGLQVEFAKRVEIGASLPVTFDGFASLGGQVVWVTQDRVGLALPRNSIDLREIRDDEGEG